MSNTYEYEGKVYRIVPDGDVCCRQSPCSRCAFRSDPDACRSQGHSNGGAGCITGDHHYVLDQEQA